MKAIDYLRTHGLETLCETFHIEHRRHGKYPNLVLLKYNQIESPMGEPVVQECRGIILDEANDWKVVSRPYDKFFNYGEGHAPQIDWSSACVYEKLDGSLMTLYYYCDEWMVASSGSPDASGPVNNDSSTTFSQLFWQTWSDLGYKMPTSKDHCYMFELMTPRNRIVVPHTESRIVMHGERNLFGDFEEHNPAMTATLQGWELVKHYPVTTIEECIQAAEIANPMQQEGFVVVDDHFNRIKVKSPQYVALAHMKDGFSDRRMIELVRSNEGEEFLNYFPEFEPLYQKYRALFNTLVEELETAYAKLKNIPIQKDFALEAQKVRCSGALFSARNKGIDIRRYLADMSVQALEKLLVVVDPSV